MTEGDRTEPADWRRAVRDGRRPAADDRARWGKVVLTGAVLLALAGALAAWLLLLSPFERPYFVALALTEYDDPRLPVQAFVREDAEALLAHFQPANPARPFGSQRRQRLLDEVEALAQVRGRPVVVYLCGLARTEGGEIFLLTGESRPDDRALPLAEVLRALKKCPAPKLLLLDVARPLAAPERGVAVDDVAERLPALLESAAASGLWVLSACAPGQSSLVSEDLRHSAFIYYTDLGLRGAAGGRVTMRELAAFVRDRVDRWAWVSRGTRQTPRLFGPDGDFALTTGERAGPAGDPPEAPAYPPWLAEAWRRRDAGAEAGRLLAPADLRRLEAALLRAEQRWRGGAADDATRPDLRRALTEFDDRLAQARKEVPSPEEPRSLALAARLAGSKPDAALQEAARGLLARAEAAPAEKAKEELPKALAEFRDKVKDRPGVEAALALLAVALEDGNPRPDKLLLLDGVLSSLKAPAGPFAETVLSGRLARLAAAPAKPENAWPARAVHLALRASAAGEEAANVDPRFFRPARAAVESADEKRREGERLLFGRDAAEAPRAARLLQEAVGEYEQAGTAAAGLARAHAVYEQALTLLPDLPAYLAGLPEAPARDRAWRAALEEAGELGQLLAEDVPARDELRRRAATLEESLTPLSRSFEPDGVKKLARAAKEGNLRALDEIDLLLATPRLAAGDRVALWNAAREAGRGLLGDVSRRAPPGEDDSAARVAEGRWAALRRARVTIDVLALDGGAGGEEARLRQALDGAAAAKGDPTAWDELGRSLLRTWAERLPERARRPLEKGAGRKELLAAERLTRMLYPPETAGKGFPAAPTLSLRRQEAAEYWGWLAERYRREGRATPGAGVAGDFYSRTAAEYSRLIP